MNTNNQSYKENLIAEELNAARSLHSLLKKEHEALNNLKTSAAEIASLAAEKEQQLNTLEKASQNRIAQLPPSDPELLTEPLKSSWLQLKTLAQHCQQQNQLNGIIINSTRNYVEQATAILLGKELSTELQYGSSGKTVPQNQARTIAKA